MISKNKLDYSNGFSMIELMVTVAILAVVTSAAAPNFSDYMEQSAVNSEVQQLASVFKMARTTALSRTQTINVAWNATNANIVSDGQTVLPGNIMVTDPASSNPDAGGGGTGVEILHDGPYTQDRLFIEDNESGDDAIAFNAQGRAIGLTLAGGGTALIIAYCKDPGDFINSQTVQVSTIGRVVVVDNNDGAQIDCS